MNASRASDNEYCTTMYKNPNNTMQYPRLGKDGKSWKLTPDQIALARELSQQGLTAVAIGKHLGVTGQAVRYHINPSTNQATKKYALEHSKGRPDYKRTDEAFIKYRNKIAIVYTARYKQKRLRQVLGEDDYKKYRYYWDNIAPKLEGIWDAQESN